MPQAGQDLREKMEIYFGDPVGDWGPFAFLIDNDWEEEDGVLKRPPRPISDKEVDCACFLCDEWDYTIQGGLK